jgi:glutaredoxin
LIFKYIQGQTSVLSSFIRVGWQEKLLIVFEAGRLVLNLRHMLVGTLASMLISGVCSANDDNLPLIELYSASYCGECARAKAYLEKHKITFTDYDIENDIQRRREFYARGGVAIPLFFIGGRKMEGFNEEHFEALRHGAF